MRYLTSSSVPFVGAVVYACVTPLGIAVGLGVRETCVRSSPLTQSPTYLVPITDTTPIPLPPSSSPVSSTPSPPEFSCEPLATSFVHSILTPLAATLDSSSCSLTTSSLTRRWRPRPATARLPTRCKQFALSPESLIDLVLYVLAAAFCLEQD